MSKLFDSSVTQSMPGWFISHYFLFLSSSCKGLKTSTTVEI